MSFNSNNRNWFDNDIKSAFAGNVLEMYSTDLCYDRDIGVSKDVKEAFKWYLMAAENEHSLAQFNLGSTANNGCINSQYGFFEGCGTEIDIKAIYWLNKADENGNSLMVLLVETNEMRYK
ncbi:hypothetical protein Glove_37g57 [Diversispora epigaea]|uniref:Sel1 repeat family protein n=1 Tax=Diversispora epigaea TaxID=1348612 RepID=A0A397JS49_9GLOM|nr:hypothetical protein Glove_37g57 [Diversispora epigaea]